MSLTQKQLRELLTYDPATGVFRWRTKPNRRIVVGEIAGSTMLSGRHHISVGGRYYYASRLAWLYVTGRWPKDEIDHINQDQSDNRFGNLRQASRSENLRNRRGGVLGRSLPKGVHKLGNKYQARIGIDHKQIYLGLFPTVKLAAAAYAAAVGKLHGEFAYHHTKEN